MGRRTVWRLLALLLFCFVNSPARAVPFSTGADGALLVNGGVSLALPADGVFNFTTITINPSSSLTFVKNALNTPVFLFATGDVIINGVISVSASSFPLGSQESGPGGGNGGDQGIGSIQAPTNGEGPSPGQVGTGISAGGGGGMATPGLQAIRHTGPFPGAGGGAIALPSVLTGGSGGAGGAGVEFFGLHLEGGVGGGAGGGIRIATEGNILVNGAITANGAWGGDGISTGGNRPGGGGSGGMIDLVAADILLGGSAVVQALGGPGGGISSIPTTHPDFSSGANGGDGFVTMTELPEPGVALLLAFGLGGLAFRGRPR